MKDIIEITGGLLIIVGILFVFALSISKIVHIGDKPNEVNIQSS